MTTSTVAKITQTDAAENLPRNEREAERRRQSKIALAGKLRDNTTLRAIAHSARDRDAKARIAGLLDDVFDLREDLIVWAEEGK
jgi:hypothetical protein